MINNNTRWASPFNSKVFLKAHFVTVTCSKIRTPPLLKCSSLLNHGGKREKSTRLNSCLVISSFILPQRDFFIITILGQGKITEEWLFPLHNRSCLHLVRSAFDVSNIITSLTKIKLGSNMKSPSREMATFSPNKQRRIQDFS